MLQHCFEASQVSTIVNAESLGLSAAFPYLGLTVTYNNSDWASLYHNLCNVCRQWGVVGKVTKKIGTMVQTQGVFYKAITQLVLLYGIKTWMVKGA